MTIRQLKIPIFIVVTFSFALGIAWGVKVQRDRAMARGQLKNPSQIRVLSLHGILSRKILSDFETSSGIQVNLTETQTPEELWDKLEKADPAQGYDAFSVLSYQLPLAMQLARIERVDLKLLGNAAAISPDFSHIPNELNHEAVIPILWGMTGLLVDRRQYPDGLSSLQQALQDASPSNHVGLLNSTIDIARELNLGSGLGSGLDSSVDAGSAPGATADPKRSEISAGELRQQLGQLLTNVDLSEDALSAAAFFKNPTPPRVFQINHGESVFPPANDKNWQFTWPQEKASLWILSYALVRDSKRAPEVHQFFDFLLKQASAFELIKTARQASTNRFVEDSELDARLKPSYFRQTSLTQTMLPKDFSRSRELRSLLNDRSSLPQGQLVKASAKSTKAALKSSPKPVVKKVTAPRAEPVDTPASSVPPSAPDAAPAAPVTPPDHS